MSDHVDEREDVPADLSALDITRDPEAFERLAGRIAAAAAIRLEARRRRRRAHLAVVLEWRRPVLAAAGLIAAVALGVLWRIEAPARGAPGAVPGSTSAAIAAAAVGVPRPLVRIVASGGSPHVEDVVALLGGYAQ